MTEVHALRRSAATLALIPAAAGIFGASVAWAGAHDPLVATATTAVPAMPEPTPAAASGPTAEDQQLANLTGQVLAAQARIAALRATLATQAADAESARVQATQAAAAQAAAVAAQSGAARSAPRAAQAPAPAAPPVDVVTGASG